MKTRILILSTVGILFLVTLIACAPTKNQYGKDISLTEITGISDILTESKSHEGKLVLLEGRIVTECPTGCWFNLKDDSGLIYVDVKPSGFAIPQITGKAVMVEGKVKLQGKKPILIGEGVKIK